MRFLPFRRAIAPGVVVLALTACNDEPDFGLGGWTASEDTVTLYTVDLPEYQGLPSAYDIRATRTVRIEDPGATGVWDFALTGGGDAPLTLTPLGAFFDVGNTAGLTTATPDVPFEELDRAPSANDDYVTDEPVTLVADAIYIVRSRSSGNCLVFAKLEPLAMDQAEGTLTFRIVANPNCNDTDLVPPEDD